MYKSEYKELRDKDWLEEHYVNQGMSIGAISRMVGCAFPAAKRALQNHDIPIRPRYASKYPMLNDKEWLIKSYVEDGMTGTEIANIVGCPSSLVGSHLGYLGITMRPRQERTGSKSNHWKGGRKVQDGYIYLYCPGHPRTTRTDPYVQEHRLIMEKQLGRYLEPYEVVHHKDGDRQNNDPDNLVVKTRGQHLSDHFKASHEVLQMRIEIKQLKARIAELESELECENDIQWSKCK